MYNVTKSFNMIRQIANNNTIEFNESVLRGTNSIIVLKLIYTYCRRIKYTKEVKTWYMSLDYEDMEALNDDKYGRPSVYNNPLDWIYRHTGSETLFMINMVSSNKLALKFLKNKIMDDAHAMKCLSNSRLNPLQGLIID
jgi:hypothetical protein